MNDVAAVTSVAGLSVRLALLIRPRPDTAALNVRMRADIRRAVLDCRLGGRRSAAGAAAAMAAMSSAWNLASNLPSSSFFGYLKKTSTAPSKTAMIPAM